MHHRHHHFNFPISMVAWVRWNLLGWIFYGQYLCQQWSFVFKEILSFRHTCFHSKLELNNSTFDADNHLQLPHDVNINTKQVSLSFHSTKGFCLPVALVEITWLGKEHLNHPAMPTYDT